MGIGFFLKRRASGQTVMEFTALMMILIGALIGARVYFKRGIMGRWKASMDEMTEELYDPRLTNSDVYYRTASNSIVEITTLLGGGTTTTMRTDTTNALDTRTGETRIGGYEEPL